MAWIDSKIQNKTPKILSHKLLNESAVRENKVYNRSVYSVDQDVNLPKTSLLQLYVGKHRSEWSENLNIGYTKPRQIFNDD